MVKEVYDDNKADRLMGKIEYALSSLFVYYESCIEHSEETLRTNSEDCVKELGLDGTHEGSKKWREKYLKKMGAQKSIKKK